MESRIIPPIMPDVSVLERIVGRGMENRNRRRRTRRYSVYRDSHVMPASQSALALRYASLYPAVPNILRNSPPLFELRFVGC